MVLTSFPEKLIPLMLLNALEGKPLPIYGDGANVRDWLFVEDHCAGILWPSEWKTRRQIQHRRWRESTNLQIVDRLCAEIEGILPAADNGILETAGKAELFRVKNICAGSARDMIVAMR